MSDEMPGLDDLMNAITKPLEAELAAARKVADGAMADRDALKAEVERLHNKMYDLSKVSQDYEDTLRAARDTAEAEADQYKMQLSTALDECLDTVLRENSLIVALNNQDAKLSQWRQSSTKMMDEILRLSADYVRLAEITDLMNNIGFTMQIDQRGRKYIHHDDHGDFYYSRETREDGAK